MDCRDRRSHARGVYPTQYTSRMEAARLKEEEKADTRIIVKEFLLEGRNVGTKGKSSKQGLISAKDLTMELPEGCESLYHRLD